MTNQEVELLIPVDQFLGILDICEKHRAEKYEMFKAANALRIQDGAEHFSVSDYGRHVLELLDESSKTLAEAKSASSFIAAESMARIYLNEWTSILTRLLNTAVIIDPERKDRFDEGFKMAISDFQRIFDQLKSIFEFAYDLAFTGQISQKDENADSSE